MSKVQRYAEGTDVPVDKLGRLMLEDLDLTFYTNRCKHQEPRAQSCRAGVRYSDLVPEQHGRMLRLPCFLTARSYDVVTCDKLVRYTREEAIAERDEMERAITTYESGKSPCCGAELSRSTASCSSVATCSKCGEFVARECDRIGEP